ncbi:MAG: NAD(P)/FAD-dependent oxidoreductase [Acidobacteriaceae bacterium]|nr:NAD(P)/FAD-dependent oxidoreductase [Acidobacteriaceae bacterium]MBV9780616.1 NAD(P)/FAD-dependent oxidoreductase [Acidobacteriaceae bacterium]
MSCSKLNNSGDDALGLNAPIQRRDLLNSTLLAAGGLLLSSVAPIQLLAEEDWTGYGGIGDYTRSNGNTYEVMTAGHRIRDENFDHASASAIDTREDFDCIVVGGGISGLAAALFFRREAGPNRTCLLLENHPIFGGEAKRNEFNVDGHRLMVHQGSAACFPPLPGTFLQSFYDSIGIDWRQFQYQTWPGGRIDLPLETAPYPTFGTTSGFFFGAKFGHPEGLWLIDPFGKQLEGAPISEQARRELLNMREVDRKPFTAHRYQPKQHGDVASRHLDSITLEQHLTEMYGLSSETVRTFLSPISGGGSGLGPDALSGYAEYAADVLLPWDYKQGAQMFPGGNTGIARHMLKALIPDAISGLPSMAAICRGRVQFTALDRKNQPTRIRLGSTVLGVKHTGEPKRSDRVEILYTKDGKLYRLRGKSAIMAGGSWTTKHIVRDLPAACRDAYAQFHRASCLMANVAVRNWRFLYKLGLTECQWFEGIGNYLVVRKVATIGTDPPAINPDLPAVLTLKILFSYPGLPVETQTSRGRAELLSTPFRVYERRIREQFTAMFARAGFDANRDIGGIILNRWGHAYLSPQPGFFFGSDGKPGPGDVLRNSPFGRISFANSDLSGIMDHRTSILEARRAVQQILERI